MEFIKTNLNPSGKKSSDCVVRAIMRATKQTWSETYQGLCEQGAKMYGMPNEKRVFEKYLQNLGWKKQKMPKDQHGFRYPVHKLAHEKPNEVMIISVAKHLTVVENNKMIDTWDCANKCVGNYWTK